jgi:hypothetical protein
MRDHSLMNPDHLKAEISYIETFIVPRRAERTADLHSRIDKAFKPFNITNMRDDNTYVLSRAEVENVLQALAGCEIDLSDTAETDAYYLKKYKALLTDRRWLIASKLKFLAR